MKFNIASILKSEGSSMKMEDEAELGLVRYLGNSFDFKTPVRVEGVIRNVGGSIEMTGTLRGEYVSRCDRCGTEVKGEIDEKIDEHIDADAEDFDPECFSLSGSVLDISGLVNSIVWGSLPMKVLCREDCKGLCSICGCNLNEKVCNCDHTVYDPRLAILREVYSKTLDNNER